MKVINNSYAVLDNTPRKFLLAIIMMIAVFVLGCQRTNDSNESLSVVSDIIPIAQLISDVVGDVAEVHHVIPNGVDLHSFSMRPSDLVTLERADVIVTVGSFFVDIDSVIQNLKSVPVVVDLTKVVDVIAISDEHDRDEDRIDEHEDEHGHDDHHGGIDPHIWLIPDNLIVIASGVAQTLQEIDASNAERYAANLSEVVDKLTVISGLYRDSFTSCTVPYLVTDHNAFGYYEHEYGLQTEALGHVEHTQIASTEDVRRLIDTINTYSIPLIFNVYGTHDDSINSIAEQTSAQVATLYHMESFPTDGTVQMYTDALRYNYEIISANLECGAK